MDVTKYRITDLDGSNPRMVIRAYIEAAVSLTLITASLTCVYAALVVLLGWS